MDTHNEQMKSINHFWITKKDEVKNIKSIDEVYNIYVKYHTESGTYTVTPINKYKFRTLIRKKGYNNSK